MQNLENGANSGHRELECYIPTIFCARKRSEWWIDKMKKEKKRVVCTNCWRRLVCTHEKMRAGPLGQSECMYEWADMKSNKRSPITSSTWGLARPAWSKLLDEPRMRQAASNNPPGSQEFWSPHHFSPVAYSWKFPAFFAHSCFGELFGFTIALGWRQITNLMGGDPRNPSKRSPPHHAMPKVKPKHLDCLSTK